MRLIGGVLMRAMGPSVAGAIGTAACAGVLVAMLQGG